MAGAAGIPAVICDGTAEGTLLAAAAGEPVGTRFTPHPERASSFKLWLRYAKPSHGTLARRRRRRPRPARERQQPAAGRASPRSRASSRRATPSRSRADGKAIGKGIVNYSADELRRIKGMRTDKVRELLPHASEEAVHRDYFVLT